MLLSFSVENYKSFKDKTVFSMEPAPKQKGLDYSILHEKIGNKEYKGLSTAVIYGPNAAGKTNLISAIQTFKNIIKNGNIKDSAPSSPNAAEAYLELIPNNTLSNAKPIEFFIKFIHEKIIFAYQLKIFVGKFMEKPSNNREVVEEILEINNKRIFIRNSEGVVFSNLQSVESYLSLGFLQNQNIAFAIASNSIEKDNLFLTNGFRTIVSSVLANKILKYFSTFLQTMYHSEAMYFTPVFKARFLEDKYLNSAVKEFGINSNTLVYVNTKSDQPPTLYSKFSEKQYNLVPSEIFESYGTLRFVTIFPMVADALRLGSTLIIDEFDASIHPMIIMNLIGIFHNDEININKAQLIFNTHNPIYLNNNLFRRDEIKFVERDDNTQSSKYYALSDFGTTGTKARKGKDYMKNYFVNEYGAIKDVDFSSVFEEMLKGKDEEIK